MDSKITGNLLPRLQRILDRLLELFRVRLDVGTKAGNQLTVRSDEELVEVPAQEFDVNNSANCLGGIIVNTLTVSDEFIDRLG